MRRKYRFADRYAAEAEVTRLEHEVTRLAVAVNAALNDRIQWLPTASAPDEGASYYRFGVIARRFSAFAVVQFFAPATGQAPHAAVYPEEWVDEEIRRFASVVPSDREQLDYRSGLYALREAINAALAAAA